MFKNPLKVKQVEFVSYNEFKEKLLMKHEQQMLDESIGADITWPTAEKHTLVTGKYVKEQLKKIAIIGEYSWFTDELLIDLNS